MTTDPQPVYWTQFPTTALTGRDGLPIDWHDHGAAHRAVSRLFAPGLPGEADERRASAGILYRVDVLGSGNDVVLVQSTVAPELVPATARTMAVPPARWTVATGTEVAFRLAVNPIKRTTRYFDADHAEVRVRDREKGSVRRTARVVGADEIGEWLTSKIGGGLANVDVLNHRRDETRTGAHKIVVDSIDGTAVVVDEYQLDMLRRAGVGRSKAYGCGLLTVVPRFRER